MTYMDFTLQLAKVERTRMLRVFAEAGDDQQAAVEGVLWALLNSRGFVYNH